MSRYDISKFNPIPDQELICGICMHILDMPKESPCRHVFCKVCIGQALQEKSKCPICRTPFRESHLKDVLPLVQNMLNKLTMHCDNYDNGCKELISMERFLNHIESCNYVLVTCKYHGCGQSLLKLNQEHHETNECIYRDIVCTEGCGLSIPWKDREFHKCMEALLAYKHDLTSQNKLLESKIEDLNSIITALNNKLQECESKDSKNKEQKTDANQGEVPETSLHSDSDVIGSPVLSYSSLNSHYYDDYDDYLSEPYSETSFVGQNDPVYPEDYSPNRPDTTENEEPEHAEFDPDYAANDVDENLGLPRNRPEHAEFNPDYAANDVDENLGLPRNEDWEDSEMQAHASSPLHYESVDDGVYPYEPSEEGETHEMPHISEEAERSVQVAAMSSFPSDTEDSVSRGRDVSSRKRHQRYKETIQNKRLRTDYLEVEHDSTVRRSRRLQNQDPSPSSEIPYVDVPPSISYLLDMYANEDSSSDDDSWSPSHEQYL